MKNNIKVTLFVILFSISVLGQDQFNFYKSFDVTAKNELEILRIDELVSVDVKALNDIDKRFNVDAFIIYSDDKEVPSQLYNNGFDCTILWLTDFQPNQTKTFTIKYLESGKLRKDYKPRTYSELAMKFDAVYKDKKFTSDHFENYTKVVVPEIHTDHDALFKYEGPGWESEKVGYRFYLDWRNATDIFGKKVNDLVLHRVGTNDVVANKDSYHEMQDWGMDIFKVGNSLGIGSISMMHTDSIYMVSKTDEITCEISHNGPILSEVKTTYRGWTVNDNKYDLISKYSILGGSRITNANLTIYDNAQNITTGLAKYENTDFMKSNSNGDWQYIALYGKQTLNNDNLGIVLFYKKSSFIKQGEDKLNYYVSLKPQDGKVSYAFGAAWELEPNGIKNKVEFERYIENEIMKLNNPVKIVIE